MTGYPVGQTAFPDGSIARQQVGGGSWYVLSRGNPVSYAGERNKSEAEKWVERVDAAKSATIALYEGAAMNTGEGE